MGTFILLAGHPGLVGVLIGVLVGAKGPWKVPLVTSRGHSPFPLVNWRLYHSHKEQNPGKDGFHPIQTAARKLMVYRLVL